MIARSYKYRCYPTAQQTRLLAAWQAACWDVQRLCIQQRRAAERQLSISVWGGCGKRRDGTPYERWYHRTWRAQRPTWASQGREVTALRADDPDLAAVPADTMSAVVRRVDEAYKRAWDARKQGKYVQVRWADRASDIGLQFRGQPERGTVCVSAEGRTARWSLAGATRALGTIAVRMHRPMPDGVQVKQAHLTCEADGWYIAFSCQIPTPEPERPATIDLHGVNLNCRHEGDRQSIARLNTGKVYQIDAAAAAVDRRMATLQKLVSPTRATRGTAKAADPSSRRTAKRQKQIAKIHQRVARQREHQQQFVAKRVVQQANTIAVEDTNYAAMRQIEAKQHQDGERRARRITNRSMSRAAPGHLRALIVEKAETAGRHVVQVAAAQITQVCSVCDHLLDPPIGLDVVYWICPKCETRHHRDTNAAQNVKRRVAQR